MYTSDKDVDWSDSGFIAPENMSAQWREITLLQLRGHSVLYRAKRYGRWFVLKGLPYEQQHLTDSRMLQEKEFRLGLQLVHPNIVATYALEEVPGCGQCIVLEAVDGQTLDSWLAIKPSHAKRKRVLSQLLDAIEYLHGWQLVHHDLKPSNILITHNGENLKLIDFGLSNTDDAATPLPNDVQDDLLRLADLIPFFRLPEFAPIVYGCRKHRYRNIADIRHSLSVHRRAKIGVFISLIIIALLGCCGLIWQAQSERRQAQDLLAHSRQERIVTEQATRQTQQTLIEAQQERMQAEQERLLAQQEQARAKQELLATQQAWDTAHPDYVEEKRKQRQMTDAVMVCMSHERERLLNALHRRNIIDDMMEAYGWISLRDSFAVVYADDVPLQTACLNLIDQQYLQLQQEMREEVKRSGAKYLDAARTP